LVLAPKLVWITVCGIGHAGTTVYFYIGGTGLKLFS
jgi:hypothetical protein